MGWENGGGGLSPHFSVGKDALIMLSLLWFKFNAKRASLLQS